MYIYFSDIFGILGKKKVKEVKRYWIVHSTWQSLIQKGEMYHVSHGACIAPARSSGKHGLSTLGLDE